MVFGQISLSNAVNYTVKDGLPSNTVYAVAQDDQGFIWFGTDAGLSRFDGLEFKNYGLKEGLPDMDILNFFKDSHGRIWMYTFNGKVCYLKNGRIYNSNNDPFLAGSDMKSRLTSIVEFEGKILVSSLYDGIKILNASASLGYALTGFGNHYLAVVDHRCYWIFLHGKSFKYYPVSELISNVELDTLKFQEFDWQGVPSFSYAIGYEGELLALSRFVNSLFYFVQIDLAKQELNIYEIHDYAVYNIELIKETLFLYTSEGVKKINAENLETSDFIKINETTKFVYDFDDNIWVSTLNSGAYFIPKRPIKKRHPLRVKNVRRLFTTPNDLYVIHNKNLVTNIIKLPDEEIDELKFIDVSFVKSFYVDSLENIWILSGSRLFRNGKLYETDYFSRGLFSQMINNEMLYHSFEKLDYLDLRNNDSYNFDYVNVGKIWDFIRFDSSILLAGSKGVFSLDLLDYSVKRMEAFDQIGVTSLSLDKFNNLWLVTNGNGLLRLPKRVLENVASTEIANYRVENYSDVYNKALIVDSVIYSSSPKGVSKFIFNENKILHTVHITASHGLEPARVVDIVIHEDEIYIGQDNGLFSFDHSEKFKDTLRFPIIIDEIHTSDSIINYEDHTVTFPHDVGLIQINAKTIYYGDHKNLSYQFRLYEDNPEANNWTTSPNNEFLFSNLSPGNYTFEARAKSINSNWTKPTSLSFKVENVYWRTLWFKMLLATFLLFLIFAAIINISRSRKRKQMLSRQKIESDLKALKAQINPHFLFNSLNSIHSFILEKENQLAEEYLLKYSKFMRNILNHSDEMSISLDDEMEAIKLYVELEKIRINKPIEFTCDVSDLDVTSTKAPSMIIQPLIENAIWHGIQPTDRSGKIKLTFARYEDLVSVEIQDNGVGFKGGVVKDTPSGIQLVRERIELINKLNGRTTAFKIDSNEMETKITFDYPIDLN